jgi:hypothetical protein
LSNALQKSASKFKTFLYEFKLEMKSEFPSIRNKMWEIKQRLRSKVNQMESRLRLEIQASESRLRNELQTLEVKLQPELVLHRWMLRTLIAGSIAFVVRPLVRGGSDASP